ncbi:MAG: hypothetical protein KME07_06325 [Pegethrix bostrychoides GSE-TBD4-15B]|jgi:hypothetical protein|uniref:Uncharacterized protein n=1 Tax=Pegethrix bostrychoides GSE-TBD4-15B TaxID=2839662 RepID=A0A951P9H7_9CYAN|nr:hypothetical protein [Pegethrix bostrychoides GSE-TBD4-15B]
MANLSELRAAAGVAGGKHPASDRQKQIASQTIQRVKPWQKSTGPSTPAGKFVASLNVRPKPGRFTLSRLLDSRTAPDFEAECRRVDGLIERVQSSCEELRQLSNDYGVTVRAEVQLVKERRKFPDGAQVVAVYRCRLKLAFGYSEILVLLLGLPERKCLERAALLRLEFDRRIQAIAGLIEESQRKTITSRSLHSQ